MQLDLVKTYRKEKMQSIGWKKMQTATYRGNLFAYVNLNKIWQKINKIWYRRLKGVCT